MQHCYLIRHGQASFGAKNYDQLSDLGFQQAKVLGQFFANHHLGVDRIIHGSLKRQIQTAEQLAEAMKFRSELILNTNANEFDSDNLLKYYLPQLLQSSARYRQLLTGSPNWFQQSQLFAEILSALMMLWQNDEECPFESWSGFNQRVQTLFDEIYQANSSTLVVTSGGVISSALKSILDLNSKTTLDLNLVINNASITEIALKKNLQKSTKKQRIIASLVNFNNISHFIEPENKSLITKK